MKPISRRTSTSSPPPSRDRSRPSTSILPLVSGAQRPDQGQERRLAGPRRSGHHDELPGRDLDPVVEQDLVARLAFAVIVVHALDPHDGAAGGSAAAGGGAARSATMAHIRTPRPDRP